MSVAAEIKPKRTPRSFFDLLRDGRVIQVIIQIAFLIFLVGAISVVSFNVLKTLNERRLSVYFDVMTPPAGFKIAEAPDWYTPASSYGQAFLVGIQHTLQIVFPGLFFATLFGIFIGIFLLSRNWLIRSVSKVYVEVLRNTPLLVQLYFWYFIVFFALPPFKEAFSFPQEGVSFIHYRIVAYLFLILGAWWYSKRAAFPSRVTTGALAGVVVLEIALRLAGPASLDKVLAGGAMFIMIMTLWFGTKSWGDFARGFLIITVGQLFITGLYAHLLYFLGVKSLLGLTISRDAFIVNVHPLAFFSIKGMALPELGFTARFGTWMAFVMTGIAAAFGFWIYAGHVTETTGRPIARWMWATGAVLLMAVLGWFFVTLQPVPTELAVGEGDSAVVMPYDQALVSPDIPPAQEYSAAWYPLKIVLPETGNFNYERGSVITPEYTALLIGLIVYTSAFIAEIVRAGIQAISYGQIEAARALGLSYPETLRLIILPQAMRIIIPPLTNQYLNLAKNSSLAIAVAFADVYQVGQTMMNQSGQSIVGFMFIFLFFITMSMMISFLMNLVNSYFQIVTR